MEVAFATVGVVHPFASMCPSIIGRSSPEPGGSVEAPEEHEVRWCHQGSGRHGRSMRLVHFLQKHMTSLKVKTDGDELVVEAETTTP